MPKIEIIPDIAKKKRGWAFFLKIVFEVFRFVSNFVLLKSKIIKYLIV